MFKKCKKTTVAYIVMAAAFVLAGIVKLPAMAVLAMCAVFGIVTFYLGEKEGKK